MRTFFALLLLGLFASTTARAAITITPSYQTGKFVIDPKNGLTGHYVSYQILSDTNLKDCWVQITNLAGGVVTLAPSESGLVHLGALTAGVEKTAFFFLDAQTITTTAQTHTIYVYPTKPRDTSGTGNVAAGNYSIAQTFQSIRALANKVNTVTVSNSNPQLGNGFDITITGNTGTVGAGNTLDFTPGSITSGVNAWPANAFQVVSSSISYGGLPTVVDTLFFTAPNPANSAYTAVFHVRAINVTTSTTAVSSLANIDSGTQTKHCDPPTTAGAGISPVPIISANTSINFSKTAAPTLVTATQYNGGARTIKYTVTAANTGTGDVYIDDFVDTLPTAPGTPTYVAGSAQWDGVSTADPQINGNVDTFYGDFLVPAGSSKSLTYTMNLPPNPGSYINSVIAQTNGVQLHAAASATVTLDAPDLTVSKTHPGGFTRGSTGVYTLTVTNGGNQSTMGAVSVTDTLPSGLTYASATGSGWTISNTGQTVTATRTDALNTGASYAPITVTVNVASTAPSSVTNTAAVSGGNETLTTNDTASDPTAISDGPDLTVAKSHAGSFASGQNGVYTITVSNAGNAATAGTVTMTDVLPTGLTFVSASGTGWTVSNNAGTITATRSDALAAGASYPAITLTVAVGTAAYPSVTNSASVAGGGETNTSNDSASDTAAVTAMVPDLTVTKSHTGSFPKGGSGSYTIVVTNSGTLATNGAVSMTDTLPTGLTYASAAGTGWTFNQTGQTVTATRSDALTPSSSYPAITLQVTVSTSAVSPVTNTVTVAGGGESNTLNDTATDPTNLTAPDLTITKTHLGAFTAGVNGAYTITVTNSGDGPTDGSAVTVTDSLPTGLSYVSVSGTGWTFSTSGQNVTATRSGVLAASASFPAITLTVLPSASAYAGVANTVTVAGGGELNTTNDTATDQTAIHAPDLTVTKSHVDPMGLGQNGSYTITVTNSGNASTTAPVTVTDTIPTGMTYVSAVGAGWTFSDNGQTFTATRSDSLAAASSYPAIGLTVFTSSTAPAKVTNVVTVSGGGEGNTTNDSYSDQTNLTSKVPSLAITKSHTGSFTVGINGVYTIAIKNVGTGSTTGALVTFSDTLPAGLTFVSASGTGWTFSTSGQTVTGTRSDVLAAGASYANIVLTVSPGVAAYPSATNTATVIGGGSSQAAATDPTTVLAPDLAIAKAHTGSFTAGTNGVYTITVSNVGTSSSTGTSTVTDTLPSGLTYVSAAGTGWTLSNTGQTVTATRSDSLAASASYPVISLTVLPAPSAAPTVTNTVTVSGVQEANPANDTANDVTTVLAPDLTITKSHSGNFTSGANNSYAITVTNSGTAPTTAPVTVTDALPAGMSYVSASGTGWTFSSSGQSVTATRSDSLANGSSYPSITLTISVASSASGTITNTATVTGGGEGNISNDTASDATVIIKPPLLLLVKRITAINGVSVTGFVDDPGTTDDNNANWPSPASTYLRGALSGSVKPGDVLEYTVYFLNAGQSPATNVIICDQIPLNTVFVSDAYTGLGPGDGGLSGTEQGIALAYNLNALPTAPTNYLTNQADGDRGQLYPPGTQAPAAANIAGGFSGPLLAGSNVNGTVCVTLVTSPTTMPNATSSGVPPGSYGFIRFLARVV